MKKVSDKFRRRLKRKISIRKKIKGTGKRPRISVYKSNRYCYIQVIDD
jgi:large subunit ribosomal protein L18